MLLGIDVVAASTGLSNDGVPTPGAELWVWTDGGWSSVAQNNDAPGTEPPTPLQWHVTAPTALDSALVTAKKTLSLAVTTRSTSGTGAPAEIDTDYLDLSISYRLGGPSASSDRSGRVVSGVPRARSRTSP